MFTSFTDFIAPRHCEVCGKYIGNEKRQIEVICNDCFFLIPKAPPSEFITIRIKNNFSDEFYISKCTSLFFVSQDAPWMNVIHSLKYSGFSKVGLELGIELGRVLAGSGSSYDFIIPVPIHSARRRERGFNQSELIAKGISDFTKWQTDFKIIKRVKYTQTQTSLGSEERRLNVAEVFSPYKKSKEIKNSSILLVDDVLTTGATLNACAKVISRMGASSIDVATLGFVSN
ncbi:MAG: ComF family protein [Bacteroidota bacterium]